MITILNSSLVKVGVIKNTIEAQKVETLYGENTLSFTAVLTSKLSSLITSSSVFELDGQKYDLKTMKKSLNEENSYLIEVEAEHISYRLNNPALNEEYFTEYGLIPDILAKMLSGSGFSVGTVDSTYNYEITYSAQEEKSRRALVMELADLVTGELEFDNFTVNMHIHRGSTEPKVAIKDRNISVITYEIKKELGKADAERYTCTPIGIPKDTYSLGDNILLLNKALGIRSLLRVIRIEYNPYDDSSLSFEFANYSSDLGDAVFEIITDAVSKDALMNGIRIGPEYGFEAVRNDRKARAYFRSDAMVFQSGDGNQENPEWTDRLYYEYDSEKNETTLVFNGKFTADVIEALIGIITQALYAKRGYISELTVDRLETSDKIQRYINEDTSDMYFIRIEDQVLQFITAVYAEDEEQAESRDGEPLYWTNEDQEMTTTDGTDFPVMIYTYVETVKMENTFDYDSTLDDYIPRINLGASNGEDSKGTGAIYRGEKGLYIDYYNSQDGELRQILLNDDGVILTPELNLYGEKGNVAEITVDRVETSTKVQRYLDSDTSDLNYITLVDQFATFITGTYNSGEEQATSRNGDPLYWVSDAHEETTLKDVDFEGNENEPVMVYTYDELVKLEIAFMMSDEDEYVPVITLGAGTGTDDYGKGRIHKRTDGLYVSYFHSETGELREMQLKDEGIAFVPEIEFGGGDTNVASTNFVLSIVSTGPFESSAWTHGFNSNEELVRFLATPGAYDTAALQIRDLRVIPVTATTCKVAGYATVL